MKRVVITGAGTINALGHSVKETFEAMREGRCGIAPVMFRDVERLSIQIGGQVRNFTPEEVFNRQQLVLYDRFTQFSLLAAKEALEQSGLVFTGTRPRKAISDMTLSKLVKELGYDVHVHGFRTSFKTWAQEKTDFENEVSEMALAHTIRNKAEAAYARSNYLEKRIKMMEEWAIYLGKAAR